MLYSVSMKDIGIGIGIHNAKITNNNCQISVIQIQLISMYPPLKARFYVHQFGKNAGSLNFSVVEITEKENITSTLWWSSRELGSDWNRIQIVMPNITSR